VALSAERALYASYVALLLWLPIPLGSNRPWAIAVLEIGSFVLAACWLALWANRGAPAGAVIARAWPAHLLMAGWLAYSALHLVPLPAGLIELLSPAAARAQRLTEALGHAPRFMTLSIDPHASQRALLASLAYVAIFYLALALFNSRARVLFAVRCIVYAAVAHAVYGILMHVGNVEGEFFGTFIKHGDSAKGTFVNRNHFAGYLEMTLAMGVGLLLVGISDRSAGSWKRFAVGLLDWVLSPRMVLRLSLCVLVIALTTTHSRMGNAAFFAALLVAGVIGITMSRRAARNTVVVLASLVAIDVFIVGSWFGVEKLARRLEETALVDIQGREEPAAHALAIVRDFPLFGAGPGSFYAAFQAYRPESITAFFDHAHNDYVQFAAESGLVGFALLALFVLASLATALRAQWQRGDPLMRGISFACIMGVTSILIHSWVDFNLQIPANAAYFMVLLALGWISLHHGRQPRPQGGEPGR